MPKIELPYGQSALSVDVPKEHLVGVLEPRTMEIAPLDALFDSAWEAPIGMGNPSSLFRPGDSIVIVVTDHTRPTPTAKLLPRIWERIRSTVSAGDVTLVVATGTHRASTDEELAAILGDARKLFRVEVHDCHGDCVEVAVSSHGNPICLNRRVAEADHVISIGTIGMHYYAGYSGGRKNIYPGVASADSIERNHAMMRRPESAPCTYEGNPVSEEMVEAGRAIRYRFIVDVVLQSDGEVAKVVIGEPEEAHRVGRMFWDEYFQVPLETQADLVIASAGGHPKDINLYQAHKGEYNAGRATRDGGILYLAAACPMGVGHPVFADWVERSETPDEVRRIFEAEGFKLGGHKALYMAEDSERVELALQSEFDDDLVRQYFMTPMHDPAEAIELARSRFGNDFRVLVMPHAGATYPVLDCA